MTSAHATFDAKLAELVAEGNRQRARHTDRPSKAHTRAARFSRDVRATTKTRTT
jgi:hypothetical protein